VVDIVTLHPIAASYIAYVQGIIKRKLQRRSAIEAVVRSPRRYDVTMTREVGKGSVLTVRLPGSVEG
jgi:hypothetical protein